MNADYSHRWVTLSIHNTSSGQVRYQRCHCGRIRILTAGFTEAVVLPISRSCTGPAVSIESSLPKPGATAANR